MPEKVTKEEALVRQTVEQIRLVKQLIQQENEVNLPYDDDMEEVKVKRPKAENDNTKIENNKDTHSGYGLAGEESEFKKASQLPNSKLKNQLNRAFDDVYSLINPLVEKNILDYDKHLMEFTRIVDVIMRDLGFE